MSINGILDVRKSKLVPHRINGESTQMIQSCGFYQSHFQPWNIPQSVASVSLTVKYLFWVRLIFEDDRIFSLSGIAPFCTQQKASILYVSFGCSSLKTFLSRLSAPCIQEGEVHWLAFVPYGRWLLVITLALPDNSGSCGILWNFLDPLGHPLLLPPPPLQSIWFPEVSIP